MEAFWIIQSSFSLFGTKLARKQQKNYPIFFMIFLVLSILWTKNARKSAEINFRDSVVLQTNFDGAAVFLDTIEPSRSLCIWRPKKGKYQVSIKITCLTVEVSI